MSDELEAARETNRRLNRRIQELESRDAKALRATGYWDLRAEIEAYRHRQTSFVDFDRLLAAHREMKECYEAAAAVLGLPAGTYHSVMDSKTEGAGRGFISTNGKVFANVFINYPKGGVQSFGVVETVRRAIDLKQGAGK